jgi:hypothetical protein
LDVPDGVDSVSVERDMTEVKRHDLVPVAVLVAVLVSVAVAWAYQGQQGRERECAERYAAAVSAEDTAAVDALVVGAGWASAPQSCGELRRGDR